MITNTERNFLKDMDPTRGKSIEQIDKEHYEEQCRVNKLNAPMGFILGAEYDILPGRLVVSTKSGITGTYYGEVLNGKAAIHTTAGNKLVKFKNLITVGYID